MSNESPIDHSNANGVTTVFPYSFLILDENDLDVYLDDSLASPALYTVSGVGVNTGGNITFLVAPANGVIVTRIRNVALVRLVDYQSAGDFLAETVDGDFNRIWQVLQQQSLAAGRSLHVGISDATATEGLQLPAPSNRAGLYLAFDADGKAVVSAGSGADAGLRTDLATPSDGRGSDLVAFKDSVVTAPAFLKTTSDIINGERVSSMRWIATKAERDAIIARTTTTDHTTVLNQMFQDLKLGKKRSLFWHPGLYNGSDRVKAVSDLDIQAWGATLKATSTLGDLIPLFANENPVAALNTYIDKNISIHGLEIDGNGVGVSGNRLAALAEFDCVQNVLWDNCKLKNVLYIGLAHSGSYNVNIYNQYLTAIGNPAMLLSVAGPAMWFGESGAGTRNRYVNIIGGLIEQCNEAGMNLGADYALVQGLTIRNVREAGIFSAGPHVYHRYIGNVIDGVTRMNISSSGIETGVDNVQIIGNYIANCASDNISLTDVQGAIIIGNRLGFPARETSYAGFVQASHISIITTLAAPNQPRDILIANNMPFSSGPFAYAFLNVGNSGSAPVNVSIRNNECDGQSYSNPNGKAVVVAAGKRGANFIQKDNRAGEDTGSIVKRVTLTAATGNQAITGIGFRPSEVDITVTITSTTEHMQSRAVIDCTATGGGNKCAYTAGGAGGHRSGTVDAKAVNVVSPAGVDQIIATFVSLDEDGFTLTKSTAAVAGEALIIARP